MTLARPETLAPTPAPWQRLPPALATAMRPGLEAGVSAVVAAAAAASPDFAGVEDPKFARYVGTAARVALERFLDLVGTREPALPPRFREVFVGLGAAEAREDRGPEGMLAALRAASRVMLRTSSQALARVRPVGPDELIDLSDALNAYVDELAAAATDGFARQVREQAGEGDRRRRRLAELLLRGNAPEAVVLTAAAAIGWPRLGGVVPVLLPADQARDARFRHGPDALVVERERDAVLLLRDGPRTSRAQLAEVLAGRGAVVGPMLGWAQVREGVRLAELAAAVPRSTVPASTAPGTAGDPVFADDHLAALAVQGETEALAVLSARRLAPLDQVRDAERDRLLVTLHSWLRHWGSRAEVAAELFVHPQTVSYRLKRLRDLLGADLDDPQARFELLLVLTVRPGA